jgi:glutathione S-transferase
MALRYADIDVEIREISLREKPQSMLQVSPKGTVPVLCIGGKVIDQSLDIVRWALSQSDPNGWNDIDANLAEAWIEKNDGPFKKLLDQYKYPNRHPGLDPKAVLGNACEIMLAPMEDALKANPFLMGSKMTWVDIAIFPFIRQFSMVNPSQFEELPFPKVKEWLAQRIESDLFQEVMQKHPTWIDSAPV